ncbi:MAG: thiol reductant ABC exporter subunit CydC [Rhizobiales bacterium 32-66-8]|nr:MAG: thiol reductant ABC exporter subunit CydC [Rhizobiales bacterium 32-66-8]
MSLWQDLTPVLALYGGKRRLAVLGGIALAVLTLLAGMALLGLSGWFITGTAIAGLSATSAIAFNVFLPSAGIRFLALARTGARYGERLVTHEATLGILADLRARLFLGWAAPGAAQRLLARPAKLLFRLTADIDALDSLYLRVMVPLGAALAAALATGVVFGLMAPLFGLAGAGFLLLVGIGLPLWGARAARAPARSRAHALEALRARTIDLCAGQTELVMAGRLDAQRAAVMAADARLAQADAALNRSETAVAAGFGTAGAALLAGALAVGGVLAAGGQIDAPLAALAVLIALAAMEPFAGLRRGALELTRSLLAVRRIGPRLRPVPPPLPLPEPPQGLAARLAGVEVRYPGAARAVLCDLSLDLPTGGRIALVGPSGAGKSTLLALLAGEMSAAAGRVETRSATLLTQRTELFRDSLRDNLRLAAPEAGDPQLWDALVAAGLAEDLAARPEGLDTPLGEGGLGLSGGQRRRLALARLLLRPAPLWLLDEPTEGLDAATARDVIGRIAARADGRTLVIATHIRREAEMADHLLLMQHGEIIARLQRGDPGFEAALDALRPD